MAYVAAQRIKIGGKYYTAGELVPVSEEDLEDLPKGAVMPAPSDLAEDAASAAGKLAGVPQALSAGQSVTLKAAVQKLPDDEFKKDGAIRAGALRALNTELGFEVTEEQVAAVKSEPAG